MFEIVEWFEQFFIGFQLNFKANIQLYPVKLFQQKIKFYSRNVTTWKIVNLFN